MSWMRARFGAVCFDLLHEVQLTLTPDLADMFSVLRRSVYQMRQTFRGSRGAWKGNWLSIDPWIYVVVRGNSEDGMDG